MSAGQKAILHRESAGLTEAVITRLPYELLREVFLTGWRAQELHAAHHFSLIVSSVCQSWRQVAVETPELWTRISIDILRSHTYEMVRTYLDRSSQNPLQLRIADEYTPLHVDHFGDEDLDEFENDDSDASVVTDNIKVKMMQLLTHHLSRWQVVELVCKHLSTLRIALFHFHGVASSLRSLVLRKSDQRPRPLKLNSYFVNDFSAPVVSLLSLSSVPFFLYRRPPLASSLINLKELKIAHDTVRQGILLEALSSLPNFTHLTLDTVHVITLDSPPIIRCLPHLEWVSFGNMSPDCIAGVFLQVEAPKLTTLCFKGVRDEDRTSSRRFSEILEHIAIDSYFPNLYHLIVNTGLMPMDVWLAILPAPFARRLTLHHNSVRGRPIDAVLLTMAQPLPHNQTWLCPQLEFLELRAGRIGPESLRRLVTPRLEASRQHSNSPELAPSAITTLRVTGLKSAAWQHQDKQWFMDRIRDCAFE